MLAAEQPFIALDDPLGVAELPIARALWDHNARSVRYERVDQTSSPTAVDINTAASQPRSLSHRGSDSDAWPLPLETTSIIAIMMGTATTPLMTAVQNNMAMGSMLVV